MSASQVAVFQADQNPVLHLTVKEHDICSPQDGEVLIEMLAAPINPQDVMVLKDLYPVKPANRVDDLGIPGYDGVAKVTQCGPNVEKLRPGDLVIPRRHGLGTWRTAAVVREDQLLAIRRNADPRAAAILRMGVMPAYMMLEDMRTVRPGDWVIQNGATGVIAHFVAQLAKLKGARVISVVRKGSDEDKQRSRAAASGADVVLTEEELEDTAELGNRRIVLALDGVFGSSGERLADALSANGTFVNYGSLGASSDKATLELTQKMIFWKQLTFKNFRLTNSVNARSEQELEDLLNWFQDLFANKHLTVPDLTELEWKVTESSETMNAELRKAVESAAGKNGGGTPKHLLLFGH